MEETVKNRQVIFKGYIEGMPKETDMELKDSATIEFKAQPEGSSAFLVKNLYLSCDPYMRGRMRNFHGSYIPPFVPGQPIEGFGISKVIHSDNPNFKPGDYVSGITGWEEYSLIQDTNRQLKKIDPNHQIPLSYHLGLLGMPGFTAYVGFHEVCSPKKGEYILISAASGAVGQLVGQLAKLHGCYVVGSAGSDQKVNLLKNKLGFDEAFNYKEEGADLDTALKRYFPQGIDIYFDNVGGDMLDAALLNMRVNGRIAVCGMVSEQSLSAPRGIHNVFCLITKRITMKGFLQSDYLHLFPHFAEHVTDLYTRGNLIYIEDLTRGLETAPAAFVGLFSGKNVGKQVICVANE